MDRVLIHGGHHSFACGGREGYFDDMAAVTLGSPTTFTTITPQPVFRPGSRMRPLMAYVPSRHEAILVGGLVDYLALDDVWRLDLNGAPQWQKLGVTGAGQPSPWGSSLTYDPVRDRLLQFGGGPTNSPPTAALYSLALQPSPVWQPVSVSGSPPPARSYHSAIYDPVGDRLIVFGGSSTGSFFPYPSPGTLLSDVWQLTLSPPMTWSEIAIGSATQTPRFEHSAIYDPVRQQMVVFGGITAGGAVGDVWALSLGPEPEWTQLALAAPVTLVRATVRSTTPGMIACCSSRAVAPMPSTWIRNRSGLGTPLRPRRVSLGGPMQGPSTMREVIG
jgi:hypothetical protein